MQRVRSSVITSRPVPVVSSLCAVVVVLMTVGLVLGLPLGPGAGLGAEPAAWADTPTPGVTPYETATPTPTDEPTPDPTDDEVTPTPTDEPTDAPTTVGPVPDPTVSSTPTSTAPSPTATSTETVTPSPTASPSSPSPTPTPVLVVPPTAPAAASSTVSATSALIALLVLAGVGALLYGLTRRTAVDQTVLAPVSGDLPPPTEDDVVTLMTVAGEAMIDAGFDVNDVQSDLRRIADTHQVSDAEVLAMPTLLVVSAQSGRGIRTAAVQAGQTQLQLHQVEALDEVIDQSRGGLDPRTATRRIREIYAAPPPFGPLLRLLGGTLATVGLAVLLGSSLQGLVISGLLGLMTGALVLLGSQIPARYQALVTVVAATAVALIVFLLARAGFDNDVVPCLIAPLITLLPGALLTTGMIELATGQMISGAGRLAAGFTQLLLLGVGIAGAALLVGVPELELTTTSSPLGAVGPWLAVAAFGVGITVNRCVRPRSMGWILLVLYVAYGAQVLGGLLVGGVMSAFVGALAMTPVADLVARQRGGPPAIVSFTPAFWLLVPGALGLMGVASLLSGDQAGRDSMLTTVVTMVGIALGVLVGRAVSVLLGLRRTVE